jgi:hypothetical protein
VLLDVTREDSESGAQEPDGTVRMAAGSATFDVPGPAPKAVDIGS